MQTQPGEMSFMRELAHAGKIEQGLFVAKKLWCMEHKPSNA